MLTKIKINHDSTRLRTLRVRGSISPNPEGSYVHNSTRWKDATPHMDSNSCYQLRPIIL